jgi:hypothetical protein
MITYEKIVKKPRLANSLIGMSLAEFEKLYAEFEPAHTARANSLPYTRRYKGKRQRTVGAGRKHRYALRDRLLMTLFWLRAYTTYELLGVFYGLDKTTVEDNLNDVLDTLVRMTNFSFERPQAGIPKLRSVQEVVNAVPEVRLMMEAKQQDVE